METQTDRAYGVIPLFKEGEEWKVFLINQYGRSHETFWGFPKGHAEEDETPLQAASRELREETALMIAPLEEEPSYTQEYSFVHGGVQYEKTVVYFLGYATALDFVIQEEEVHEAAWLSLEEAENKLTYEPSRAMLREVRARLFSAK